MGRFIMAGGTSVPGLCGRCEHRTVVVSKELGQVVARCQLLKMPLHELGHVTDCSYFDDQGAPYLFVREAWIIDRREDGTITARNPNEPAMYDQPPEPIAEAEQEPRGWFVRMVARVLGLEQ